MGRVIRAAGRAPGDPAPGDPTPGDRAAERERMVERQLRARGIADEHVLAAFRAVPREAFVGEGQADAAYEDRPLPIGHGQTLSQPYVVALMLEALAVRPGDRVLEVGAGSGYAAALLSRLAGRVVAVERVRELADAARRRLAALGCANVEVRHGDGTLGWPGGAPFDAVLVSAAAPDVPPALVGQLAQGGRLVMPVGDARSQELVRLVRSPDGGLGEERLGGVVFVPLIGSQEPGGREPGGRGPVPGAAG